MSWSAVGALALLLVAPGWALSRLAPLVDWRILVAVPLGISVYTFLAYRSDKLRAEAGSWRIPESTLHLSEFLGGWPGAFLGQRIFRHKTSKTSFQVTFWAIVLVHQFIAVDSLLDWRMVRHAAQVIDPASSRATSVE
jgi:uncharacterized membrane protein YsdA (DUF1294 family)